MASSRSRVLAARENGQPASDRGGRRQLIRRIATGTATIGVLGLGYVGLPLAVEYARAGFETIGFDLDRGRVDQLNDGENYNEDLDDGEVASLVSEEKLAAETEFGRLSEADVVFVCVPTPVTDHKDPDTSYLEAAAESIADHLRPGQLVIVKSTTYPGTTEELIGPVLAENTRTGDLELGEDYFLAYSPERIDPGNDQYTTANTPIVVGAVTEAGAEVARGALEAVVEDVHLVSSPRAAEMEKLLENIFRSVNIALVNELAQLCDRIGELSMWEVVEAAATKPFGFMPFYPGPGLGGHCIPVDPHYLAWLGREYDFETSFITLAARVNEEMPFYVVNSVMTALAELPTSLEQARVLILGVAFKRDVDDTRHSPAHTIIRLLREKGVGEIAYADPHVEEFSVSTRRNGAFGVPRVEASSEVVRSFDLTVVVTDHSTFDYEAIAAAAPAVIDTRNALGDLSGELDHVRTLGGGG